MTRDTRLRIVLDRTTIKIAIRADLMEETTDVEIKGDMMTGLTIEKDMVVRITMGVIQIKGANVPTKKMHRLTLDGDTMIDNDKTWHSRIE